MKVLVTGGCGYVGTKLTEALLARADHEVTVLDAQWFGNYLPTHPRLTVLAMDMRTIDDLVDVYLFAFDRRLAGVYNAGFENLTVLEIAHRIAERVPAEVKVTPSNDPRSYRVCSDRLVATGFAPRKNVATAIDDLVAAYREGRLKDEPVAYNVTWMKQHHLGGAK